MKYENIYPAEFIDRPNRFVARVLLYGETVICHVKNTGRCRELLQPGAPVWIQASANPARKTAWDLIAVQKGFRLINMDSQAPNQAAEEWLRDGGLGEPPTLLKPECRHGGSRFDFYAEFNGTDKPRRLFLEVKGVTLEEDGICLFPDAPTERGLKHIRELAACCEQGYEAAVLFVIQMQDVLTFTPNRRMQPAFAEALIQARKAGVSVLARDCSVTPDSLAIRSPVPVLL
jgi:sugar fermentation stimulation protein